MNLTYSQYLELKKIVTQYESENINNEESPLLVDVLSRRLYNGIIAIMDNKQEFSAKRLPRGKNLYNINDMRKLELNEIKKCTNLGKKSFDEFLLWFTA